LLGKIFITKTIEKELLCNEYPETDIIRNAVGHWIVSVNVKGDTSTYVKYGLDKGEATLFLTGKKARLVIDELNARRVADVENREYTGLLGLIVAAVETGKLPKKRAKDIIDKLAESDFRMTVALYKRVMDRIEKV
jgi:predicted nucleic acid-binding protein